MQTFYDFDQAEGTHGPEPQLEMIQPGPQVKRNVMPPTTELTESAGWDIRSGGVLNASAVVPSWMRWYNVDQETAEAAMETLETSWPSSVFSAGTFGVGGDNPLSAEALDEQQKDRSVMMELINVNEWYVRLGIYRCCTTGRNFMIGGFAPILPICPQPPPSPPTARTD